MIKMEIPDIFVFLSQKGFSEELLKYLLQDRYKAILPLIKTAEIQSLYKELGLAVEQCELLQKEYNNQFSVESRKGNDSAISFAFTHDDTEHVRQKEIRLDRLHELTVAFQKADPDFPIYKKDRYSIMYERFEFLLKMFF